MDSTYISIRLSCLEWDFQIQIIFLAGLTSDPINSCKIINQVLLLIM